MGAHNYFLILVSLIYFLSDIKAAESTRVKITVGTTAGCSDTVNFIRDQLWPTYRQYAEFLEIEYVPWGRTERDENGTFTFCQFRPSNCWANRMHRCALNLLEGNQTRQLEFMSCEFTSPFPGFLQESYACVREVGLNMVNVDYCLNNPHLDTLDDKAEAASANPMGVINFVPYIVVNDNVNLDGHNQARRRLSSVVCFLLAEDPSTGVARCQV